jgi:hypothetical protein
VAGANHLHCFVDVICIQTPQADRSEKTKTQINLESNQLMIAGVCLEYDVETKTKKVTTKYKTCRCGADTSTNWHCKHGNSSLNFPARHIKALFMHYNYDIAHT